MKTLAVWSSPTADGVDIALDRLRALAAERRIAIDDAAAVSWPPSRRRPELSEQGSLVGPGALWGGFWGLFVGLICVTPLAGLSFGAAAGAVAGSLADFGIDGVFISTSATRLSRACRLSSCSPRPRRSTGPRRSWVTSRGACGRQTSDESTTVAREAQSSGAVALMAKEHLTCAMLRGLWAIHGPLV